MTPEKEGFIDCLFGLDISDNPYCQINGYTNWRDWTEGFWKAKHRFPELALLDHCNGSA